MTGLALTQLVTTPDELGETMARLRVVADQRAAAEADLARMEQERRAMLAEQIRSTVRGVR